MSEKDVRKLAEAVKFAYEDVQIIVDAQDRGLNTFVIIAQTEDGQELARSNLLRLSDFDLKTGLTKLKRCFHQVGARGQDVADAKKG